MEYPHLRSMFAALKQAVLEDKLTPATKIDEDTLVCFTGINPQHGKKDYYQSEFSKLPLEHQQAFKGKTVGDKVGNCKIFGVYDVWTEL